jgi:hypothetical protein
MSLKVSVSDPKNRYYYHTFYSVVFEGYEGNKYVVLPDERHRINVPIDWQGRTITPEQRREVAEREFNAYMKVRGTRTSWNP